MSDQEDGVLEDGVLEGHMSFQEKKSHLQPCKKIKKTEIWGLWIQPLQQLKNKLANHGQLKYVWNVFCVLTNHKWDLQTTETTENGYVPLDTEQIRKMFSIFFFNFRSFFLPLWWIKKGFSCLVWCDYIPSNFNVLKWWLFRCWVLPLCVHCKACTAKWNHHHYQGYLGHTSDKHTVKEYKSQRQTA